MHNFSLEYFPPRTPDQAERLKRTRGKLAALKPQYCSVTFGAGGSTRDGTLETVLAIHREDGVQAAPHISCMGGDEALLSELLARYKEAGIHRLVVLRGDRPSGVAAAGAFNFASDLVAWVRKNTGDHFEIEVACYPECHPEARNALDNVAHLKQKVEAGADAAITQYFFNADAYFRFVESCQAAGIDIPIIPGIMPITNYTQLARFSDMCGAELPRWLRKQLEVLEDDKQSLLDFGADVVTQLCQRLIEGGAPGLHFYTLNRAQATMRIWENLL